MSPDVLIPALLLAVGLFFLLRRWSELPAPQRPQTDMPRPAATEASPDTILITHPMIRRAALKALEDGGDTAAKYIQKRGDQIYFTLSAIKDPIERRKALDTIRGIQEGEDVGIAEAIQLLRRLFSGK
jgi:hypothetical protein